MKRTVLMAAALLALVACGGPKKGKTPEAQEAPEGQVLAERFDTTVNNVPVALYTLSNGDITLQVTNFGGRIVTLLAPDRNGMMDNIVLGRPSISEYVNAAGERFLGACVGPVANRIGKASFTVDGVEYKVPANDNEVNTLHGGFYGFDNVPWQVVEAKDTYIVFRYDRPDGFEGFPGNLDVTMRYMLTSDNQLEIEYSAFTDKATPVNISHHSFFNLRGEGNGDVLDYIMTINASKYTPIDALSIPLGENVSVEGTPFDFRQPHAIGERIDQADNEQIANAHGYDHNWVLDRRTKNGIELACTVIDPESGRTLEVYTDQPGLQFYSGNFFKGEGTGVSGKAFDHRCSIALETQCFPDSPNRPNFPSVILRPGQTYKHTCIYKFGVAPQEEATVDSGADLEVISE